MANITGGTFTQNNTTANITVNVQVNQAIAQFNQLQNTINNMANRLNSSFARTNTGLNALSRSSNGLFANMVKNASNMDLSLRRIHASTIALGFAFYGAAKQAAGFFERAVNMEQFRTQLATISGGVNEANKSIEQIFNLAKRVPFDLDSITQSFTRLKTAGIEPITDAQGNGPLKTLMDAFASFGPDSEVFKRGIVAISQMAGKGVVSMEELRQQLGEAMPSALRIAAQAMGMTVGEFVDQVSKGKVSFDSFFDKFIARTEQIYGGNSEKMISNFKGAWAQLNTAIDRVADALLNTSGIMPKFTAMVREATDKIYEFISFLQTPMGAVWLDQLWESFKQIAFWVAEAIVPAQNLITIIGNMGSALSGLTNAMPAEIAGGGILGYVLFGAKGAVAGALFGAYSSQIAEALSLNADFVSTTVELFNSVMGTDAGAGAVTGGLLGFLIAGPQGALAGAVAGAIIAAKDEVAKFVNMILAYMGVLREGIASIFSGEGIVGLDELLKRSAENNAKYMKQISAGLFGTGAAGEQSGLAGPTWSGIANGMAGVGKGNLPGNLDLNTQQIQSQADTNTAILQKFFDNVEQRSSQATQTISDNLSTIPEGVKAELSKVDVDLGEAGTRGFASQKEALEGLLGYAHQLSTAMGDADKKIDEAMRSGDTATQKRYEDLHTRLQEQATVTEAKLKELGSTKMTNLAEEFDKARGSLAEFTSTVPDSFSKQAVLTKQLEEQRTAIDNLKNSLDGANISTEARAALTEQLNQMESEYAKTQELVAAHVDPEPYVKAAKAKKASADASDKLANAEARANNAAEQAQTKILSLTESVNKMIGDAGGDSEAAKVQQKTDEINKMAQQIQQEIVRIKGLTARGIMSPDAAASDIAQLEALATKLDQNREKIIDSMTASGQAWKDFMGNITSAMESSISDGIYGLVTGTKSAKDVLLDFYNAITKAAADYIAKQLMIGLFGGGGVGSGGGLFGGLLGFANGGSFMVDGRGGVDQNIVAFKASKGERVSIQTKEQQRGGGGGDTFVIHAIDAKGVSELFMRHGSALQSALNQRTRLNHR